MSGQHADVGDGRVAVTGAGQETKVISFYIRPAGGGSVSVTGAPFLQLQGNETTEFE